MKRKISLVAVIAVCMIVLSGCQCSHEWTDADCLTPKTCAKCGETEGEALGHSWAAATCAAPKTCTGCGLTEGDVLDHVWTEATCAAPKTCTGCGLTEGEALEHTWVGANYQTPQTCSVCSQTEGDPLPAAFEAYGFQIDMTETGVPYALTLNGIPFQVTVTSYETYPSDSTHEAKDGYEWQTVGLTIEALENQGSLSTTLPHYVDYNNYYDLEGFNSSITQVKTNAILALSHNINYNGTDYECLFQLDKDHLDRDGSSTWVCENILSFRVPVGFDGIVICVGDAAVMNGNYQNVYMNLYRDEDTVFFRLA